MYRIHAVSITVQNVPGLRLYPSQVTLLHGICSGAGIIANVLLLPPYSFLSAFPLFLSTDKESGLCRTGFYLAQYLATSG